MKDIGGKGKCGLWLIAHRNPFSRNPHTGGYELDGGFMLSVLPKQQWLFSFGVRGIGTLGFGWVSKTQRQHDQMHADGVEHSH